MIRQVTPPLRPSGIFREPEQGEEGQGQEGQWQRLPHELFHRLMQDLPLTTESMNNVESKLVDAVEERRCVRTIECKFSFKKVEMRGESV